MPQSDELKKEIEQLVVRAKDGDSASFGRIYDIIADDIYKYVFFRISHQQDAQDLTEMVFMRAWENLKRYKEAKNFTSWIFKIAHNAVIDHYRMNKHIEELTEDYMDDKREHSPLHNAERSMDNSTLKYAIAGLKDKYKQIIVLKYINEKSNEEIAEIMKKNEGAVRVLQFRALQELKRNLKDMGVSM
ncbi:MAG: ECF subfamily RNA polymerase sigma-24 subunit, RNA polymerase sigma-70 factor, ECF subfamily [Candidatus Peregrinibacteria bacterium GW2011_GWC2_39_14]|nr:MAG: RNA polymerase, sigma-24 subunit, ECF subfamily [Candidatus Peregrinibacteria bacterium GW2011_GWA2_38_36]KKR06899.1 MAG: ECF subfamily RNA polymerase sigma-24 subunit, RNA polymerase sigma-70 factor, ECF subfamily [Candidatus Peregrinibacteria bacterium GW2011_GWC2_39_14]